MRNALSRTPFQPPEPETLFQPSKMPSLQP